MALTLYVVVGRCCDHDDHVKVVEAKSETDAKKKFEQHVRNSEEVFEGDFYIEHIQTLSRMIACSI